MKEAIVLAGGLGTRLRTVVSDVPKPLAPVAGRPFICHLLDHLTAAGYDRIVLSTGYMADLIASRLGTSYGGAELVYAPEESPLGTGGAIVNALAMCQGKTVTALNGDTLFKVDYGQLEAFHSRCGGRLALVLRHVDDTSRYGSVSTGPDGRVVGFAEKSASGGPGWINGGVYRLDRSLLEHFVPGQPFSFEAQVLQGMYRSEPFYAYGSNTYFIDIGVPDDYARAQTELSQ